MSLRTLVSGDVHARRASLEKNLRVLDFLDEYGEKSGISFYVLNGDLMHDRVMSHNRTLVTIQRRMKASPHKIYLNKGNHDCSDTTYTTSILETFTAPNMVPVLSPLVIREGDVFLKFLPFGGEIGNQMEPEEGRPSVLFAHCAITGAKVGPEDFESIEGIPLSRLPEATVRVLSHFHKHQWLDDHSCYVGAPFPVTFGEAWEDKGILDLRIENDGRFSAELVPIPNMPKFFDFKVQKKSDIDSVRKVITGNRVRVVSSIKIPESIQQEFRAKADGGGFHYLYLKSPERREEYIEIDPASFRLEAVMRTYLDKHISNPEVLSRAHLLFNSVFEECPHFSVEPGLIEPGILHLHNFGPHSDTTIDLAQPGLTLLEGANLADGEVFDPLRVEEYTRDSNGAGKTVVAEALLWVLTGETLKGGEKKSKNQLIKFGEKECFVEHWLKVRGKQFRIKRSRPKGLELDIDGEPRTDMDLEAHLRDCLGIDRQTILQVILLGQRVQRLAYYLDLPEATQRSILDSMLGLTALAPWLEAVGRVENLTLKQKQDKESALLQVGLAMKRERLASSQESARKWEMEESARRAALDQVVKDRSSLVHSLELELSKAEEERGGLFLELHGFALQDNALYDREPEISQLQETLEDQEAGILREESALQTELGLLGKRRETLQSYALRKDPICPECGQPVTVEHLQTELSRLGKQMSKIRDRLALVASEKKKVEESRLVVSTFLDEGDALDRKVSVAVMRYQELSTQVTTLHARLTAAQAVQDPVVPENPFIPLLESDLAAVEEAMRKEAEVQDEIKDLDITLAACSELKSALGFRTGRGVRLHAYASVQERISELLHQYTYLLSRGKYSLALSLVEQDKSGEYKDKFSLTPVFPQGTMDIDFTSGGQSRRMNLAVMFAYRQIFQELCGVRCSLLILDEVFDNLDGVGKDDISRLLSDLSKSIPVIIAISHDEKIKEVFHRRLLCLNLGGFDATLVTLDS
jgi:hypothetical protein